MYQTDPNSLAQDPNQVPQPQPNNEPSLEEVAAQIKAANAQVTETALNSENQAILTTPDEIPQSSPLPVQPETPITEMPAAAIPPSTPSEPSLAPSPDAIDQLDSLPDTPTVFKSFGGKIAQVLADNEVIGEHQINEVIDVLTPELLKELAGEENETTATTIPISITNSDGTNLLVNIPSKSVFDFFAGRTDLVTASK